ncbi:hypothetical protein Gasu2_20640 [Galdieria sulphuraria]|nr:hypothetical protein Gasu2_20640 [Galdieria sulphuraria]
MSVDDGIFDFVRFEDEWPKEFSWEESNLFRTGPEKSIQGLENIFESSESDIRHHLLGASKMEYEQGSNTTVEDYFSRNFEPRTSTTQTPELVASPSNKLLGVSPEESFKSCLKTDFQGRKHYHGLYALDAVEKSFSLSPPAGLWTHTTSLKSFEQQNSPFNDTPTLSCRQSTQETQFSTPFNSREFSNMNIMPSSPLSSSSKRFKSASNESKMSFNVEVLFPAMGSTFHENDQERSSIGSKEDISQIKRRPQRKKQYSRVSPAKFCHLCARAASKNIRMIVCSNIQIGMCLKVTCEKCFQQNNWNFEEAIGNPDSWICTHCRGSCPYRAQCSIYQRTNHRRRVSRFLMKKQKELNEDYST